MARKVKFPLKMTDGSEARTLDELKEHFDIESVVGYFSDGRLLNWLQTRYYEDEAEQVDRLTKDDPQLHRKLCAIFGVESAEDVDPEEIARRQERLNKLKQFTADPEILAHVDSVAFDQEDFGDLLDEDVAEIYLCANKFTIPLRVTGKTYVGVDKAVAVIRSKEIVDFDELNITFKDIKFDDDYQRILDAREVAEQKKRAAEDAALPKKLCEEADRALDDNDPKTALEKYKRAAELGYPAAFGSIGFLYAYGADGIEPDLSEARRWYRRGMEKNDSDSFGFYAMSINTEDATEAQEREAFEKMKKAVELGGRGMFAYHLGQMYRFGDGTEKNFAEAFSCFKRGDEAGDFQCTNMLGVMFMNGEHVDKNPRKAFKFFERAADGGNISAVRNLADCYENGDGVTKDEHKAFELYKRAAENGDIESMNKVGIFYANGKGTSVDKRKAFRWYEKSAEAGFDWAMINLAGMYYDGSGTEQSYRDAIKWYEKAAEFENTFAMVALARMYRDGDGVLQDYDKATELLKKAGELGDTDAVKELAFMYSEGDGVNQNPEAAFKLHKYAAENGDVDAMVFLGNCYRYGDGTAVDMKKALRWYKKAAEAGDNWGMLNLAEMFRKGEGTAQSYSDAIRWYEKSVDLGNTYAMIELAEMYHDGLGTNENPQKEFQLIKQAAQADNTNAMKYLGDCYRNGYGTATDEHEALKWYRKAAEAGNDWGMINLAHMYRDGRGTAVNMSEAFHWYQKSAESGNHWGMLNLAHMYRDGEGVAQNTSKAIELYSRAADNGNTVALISLGYMYKSGNGVPQDFYKAAAYFKTAADSGDGDAMNALGMMYYNGQGVAQDSNLAFQWFKKSAEASSADGMSNLSLCYLWGDGVNQDMKNAEYWMNKAAENGNYTGMLNYADHIFSENRRDHRLIGLYEQVANAGYGEAAYRLAVMYRKGYGTQQNREKANYWHNRYEELGYTPDQEMIDAINGASSSNSYSSSDGGLWKVTTTIVNREGLHARPASIFVETAARFRSKIQLKAKGKTVDAKSILMIMSMGLVRGTEVTIVAEGSDARQAVSTLRDLIDSGFGEDTSGGSYSPPKKDSNCFITTAVCDSFGKTDDCSELTAFRKFRDGWLSAQPDGKSLIAEYYSIAPKIVEKINALTDAAQVYENIWHEYLEPCLKFIRRGENSDCKDKYVEMVRALKARYF